MIEFDKAEPPDRLRQRVDASLRNRGLIATPPWSRVRQLTFAVAAALAMLIGGFALGRRMPATSNADQRMRFMLLLYEDSTFIPAATGSHNAEYGAWADSLGRAGKLETGDELDRADTRLGSITRTDAEPMGYFVIRASSADEAASIARTCPHLKYRGTISVRPIKT